VSGSVLTVSSRALLEACARLGLDTDQILAAAGVDRSRLADPDARLSNAQASALWRKAFELSKDPDLALHAVEILPQGAYRVLEFLSWNAPTVGEALTKVSHYFPLINSAVRLPITRGDARVTLGIEAPSNPGLITRPYAEYTFAAIYLRTRLTTDEPYRLIEVEFSHPRPEKIREHERIFECPVKFGAPASRMVIAREVWDSPRRGSDPELFTILDAHAKMLLGRLPDDTSQTGRVREAIRAELRGGDPGLPQVARRLGMSARTLQRRLSDEGVVFNDVLDEMRWNTARSYLSRGDVAATEVAYLLGFSSQSSFNRAFKRWSGKTPTEFRRENARS
jgi:AraC-like DNA-binding protein